MLNISHAGAPSELWSSPAKLNPSRESKADKIPFYLDESMMFHSTLKHKRLDETGLFRWETDEYSLISRENGSKLLRAHIGPLEIDFKDINQVLSFGGSACRFDLILASGQTNSFLGPDASTCEKWMQALAPSDDESIEIPLDGTWNNDATIEEATLSMTRISQLEDKIAEESFNIPVKKKKLKASTKSTRVKKHSDGPRIAKPSLDSSRASRPRTTKCTPSNRVSSKPTSNTGKLKRSMLSHRRSTETKSSGIVAVKENNPNHTADLKLLCKEQKLLILELQKKLGETRIGTISEKSLQSLKMELEQVQAERNAFEQLFERSNSALAKLRKEHQVLLEKSRSSSSSSLRDHSVGRSRASTKATSKASTRRSFSFR